MSSVLVTPAKLISETVICYLKLWHTLEKHFPEATAERIMELIQVHSQLWNTLEVAYDESNDDATIGRAKRKICKLNTRRTMLENEIDENFLKWFTGEDIYPFNPTLKDYEKKK